MASILLRRHIQTTATRLIKRNVSVTAARFQASSLDESTPKRVGHDVFDTHIVEDLQGMSAHEILAEKGTRKESKMRHFTGVCWLRYVPSKTNSIDLPNASQLWVNRDTHRQSEQLLNL
jgi:hypothetical protein